MKDGLWPLYLRSIGLKDTPFLMPKQNNTKGPAPKVTAKEIPAKKISGNKPLALASTSLETLFDQVSSCTKCPLSATRKNIVFGYGATKPKLVLVGEGPGEEEDATGLPFVGRAGKLLTSMLKAINLTREEVYICNTVKCRPPKNRAPSDSELASCNPFLMEQLALLQPTLIVALGATAAHTLLEGKYVDQPLGKLRDTFYSVPIHGGIDLLITYHPSYLLRRPGEKHKAWQDLKAIKKRLLTFS